MLNVLSKSTASFCDRLSRRTFLRVGALGLGGLSLADVLRGRALAGQAGSGQAPSAQAGSARGDSAVAESVPSSKPARRRSVIMIYLPGGPSHVDMYDMKPDAPVDIRGEFRPIRTNVPGIDVCELMPGHAALADKLAVVRGVRTFGNGHDPYEILTSDPREASKLPPNPLPSFGAVVSRVRQAGAGDGSSDVPPYVGLKLLHLLPQANNDDPETPAYLGESHRPFRTSGPGLENLALANGVSRERLADRRTLLREFDDVRRTIERRLEIPGSLDTWTAQALSLVSSGAVRAAFDLSREPESVRAAYGESTDLLLALRLAEAGVSVVTVPCRYAVKLGDFKHGAIDHWDTHWHNFRYLREMLPRYDQGVSALVADLYRRGLDQEVAVVIWGEFGRTPLIDYSLVPGSAGRGHWPDAGFALFSGGGLRTGQVVGETDGRGERALGAPHTPSHVLATLYRVLGIDASQTFPDHAGRPRFILDQREPIRELL